MVRVYLNGMDLGVIDLQSHGYTVERLEACGYRVEVL
jgi:hypothetical protein